MSASTAAWTASHGVSTPRQTLSAVMGFRHRVGASPTPFGSAWLMTLTLDTGYPEVISSYFGPELAGLWHFAVLTAGSCPRQPAPCPRARRMIPQPYLRAPGSFRDVRRHIPAEARDTDR
jgi:hypothetical protein